MPALSNVEQVSVAGHGLARTTAGAVWFWGTNSYGQAGDGTTSGAHPTPVPVPGLQNITGIAVGASHSVALRNDGTVLAWGSGSLGQIGTGPVYTASTPVVVPLPGGLAAAGVGAGENASSRSSRRKVNHTTIKARRMAGPGSAEFKPASCSCSCAPEEH